VRDPAGTLRGFAKVTRDLTERKLAEEALRQSEERYRLLVSDIPEYAIYLLDPQGRVATWNPGAERLYGWSTEAITGEHFSRFYPADAIASGWPQEELRIAQAAGRFEDEGWRQRRDGSRFWANVVITSLHDREGRLYGFAKITRDMTERRKHEEAVRELNRELQVRVEQLAHTNRVLAEKSEENDSFVYSVSHDVRGPLVNLQGFAQELDLSRGEIMRAIEDADVPEAVRKRLQPLLDRDLGEAIRYIQTSVRHLSGIIDALLRLSRAGRVTYQLGVVDVSALMARLLRIMRPGIEQADAEVQVLDLPPARSDVTALEQVFSNLLSNTLRYRDPGRKCRIEIGALEAGEGQCNVYYVKDNGLGIPAGAMPKLFTAFQRLRPDVAQGEGIGLAMVRRIMDRVQGRIRAESEIGAGTTFFVEIPAAEASS
jgi:PAS domain S-box-containing protein